MCTKPAKWHSGLSTHHYSCWVGFESRSDCTEDYKNGACDLFNLVLGVNWCVQRKGSPAVLPLTCHQCTIHCGTSCVALSASKRTRAPLAIGVRAGKFLGCQGFLPNFPKLARKVLPTDFPPQKSWRPVFDVTSKKGLHLFSANVGRYFLKSNNVWCYSRPNCQGFCPDFQGFCSDFRQIKTFGGALELPAPMSPTSFPLATRDTPMRV